MRRIATAVVVVATGVAAPTGAVVATVPALAAKLHAGEFCTKSKQRSYHRHGYTCRRASDGRLRLFRR